MDGNHENFDLLAQYPAVPWRGGTIHPIRPSVLPPVAGEMCLIWGDGTLFVLGGAASHDAPDGILRQGPALRRKNGL